MAHVALDAERRSVRFLRPGVKINLGSIGKGYALDRVADQLAASRGVRHVLIHGGSSSVLARGDAHGRRPGLGRPHPSPRGPLGPPRRSPPARPGAGHLGGDVPVPRTRGPTARPHPRPAYRLARVGGRQCASVVAPSAARRRRALDGLLRRRRSTWRGDYCETHPGVGAVLLPEGGSPVVFGLAPGTYNLLTSPDAPLSPCTQEERGRG